MRKRDHVARLYAAPLSEFTATRNRLAAELRKNGRADDARALARLRKPSAPLWAVNRLATTDSKRVAALFEAVASLRRSQLRDPRAAAEALRAQRAALDTLIARGREVLGATGSSASQQALRRLSDTLMGAAVDRAHGDALRRGELTEELPAPGFEAFSGTPVAASPRLRLVRSPGAPSPPAADRQASAARAAEAERQRRLEADKAAREAADHARHVSDLEAERGRARARVAELEQQLRTARRAARQSAAAAKRARRKDDPS
jgi:hypothetical protein